jgi:hypothetical protein
MRPGQKIVAYRVDEKLANALAPFVAAYEKAACPVGDSDLYNEQPRSVSVTLGDCRRAAAVLHAHQKGVLR